jgi:glycosyltransferase involved in cell wall biosynthesis
MKVVIVRSRAIDSGFHKLAKTLADNGHTVQLLVWDRQSDLPQGYKKGQVHKFTLSAPHDQGSVILFLPLWWLYEFFILLTLDVEIIHACDFDTLFPAILAKTIKNVKLYYTIYDFYANHLPNSPLVTNTLRKIVARIEKLGVGFTDFLFLVSRSRYEWVKGALIRNIAFIYNSPPDLLVKTESLQVVKNKRLMTIFYAGMMDKTRGIEYMIEAVEDLSHVMLIFSGKILDKQIAKIISEKMHKKEMKIKYLGWLPTYFDVLKWTLKADILFRFCDPALPHAKYESPNKLFEAMMSGKPIIVNNGQATARIVREASCGIVVQYGDVKGLKKAIITLRDNAFLRRKMGNNGRKLYEKRYSWKIMQEKLLHSYKVYEKHR